MNQSPQDKIEQGFSSQQQIKPQQILYTEIINQKIQPTHKQQVKFKLPPPQQIKDKKYSLHPDIITGWQPKVHLPSPIPIIFDSPKYDNFIKRLLRINSTQDKTEIGQQIIKKIRIKLCYLGPKFQNTYYAWYDKPFAFPYTHIKSPHSIKFSQRPFCGQHWDAEDGLKFDSFFQSGNLDCVVQVGQAEYDLFMRVDSNTRGHLQWFNFKVKNLIPLKQYRLNICNFQKKKILYDRGLKPYIYSSQKYLRQKIGWQQRGQDVTYDKKLNKTYKFLGIQYTKSYKLSFTISTNYLNDQLQISYCIPYTYSQLRQYLNKKSKQLQKSAKSDILKISKLCNSLGGLEVPLLIIHQNQKNNNQKNKEDQFIMNLKKCVVVCARAHPGESNGSYMMEGFIDFICGQSKMAQFLRKHVIFKIVPMMNPDGVALGNYRTGLSGKDFNRQYRDPDKQVFPQVYAFKRLVSENKFIFKDNFQLFLDLHGHSVKKNTFSYGPQFVITNKFYYQSRILPKLMSKLTPMFRYYSCSFKIAEYKSSTARAILLKHLNIPLAYTIETSNGFYFDYQKLKDIPYTDKKWRLMGQKICHAVYEYMEMVLKTQLIRHQKNHNKHIKNIQISYNQTKDLIIRKVGRSSSKDIDKKRKRQMQFRQKSCHSVILQGIQDENIKNLFQQIKKDEQKKATLLLQQKQKCSDDQLSQGSSDSQAQQDDLSSKQLANLFKCIKNKRFKNIEKCRFSPIKRTKTDQLDKQILDQDVDSQERKTKQHHLDNKSQLTSPNQMSQQIIYKKRSYKVDTRKQFIFNLIETKKRSKTPKVINFSFGFTPQKRQNLNADQQKGGILPSSKINIFQISSTRSKKNDISINQQIHSFRNDKNRLTDLIFRKTFNHSAPKDMNFSGIFKDHKNNKQHFKQHFKGNNIFTTTNYGNKFQNIAQKTEKNIQSGPVSSQMISTCQTFYPSHARNRNVRFQNHKMKSSFIQNRGR